MAIMAGVPVKETTSGGFKLKAEGKSGKEQIYFSSDNKAVMLKVFGVDGWRCPAISSSKEDLGRQLSEAIRNSQVTIEIGRDGGGTFKTFEEKKMFWEISQAVYE